MQTRGVTLAGVVSFGLFFGLLLLAAHLSELRWHRYLTAFAASLQGGVWDPARLRVEGRLDGRQVSVQFEGRSDLERGRHRVTVFAVRVAHPAACFVVEDEGALDGLRRWLGADPGEPLAPGVKLTAGDDRAAGALQGPLLAAVKAVLDLPHEVHGVRLLEDGWLRVERLGLVHDPAELHRTFGLLVAAARLCDRRPVEAPRVRVRAAQAYAWTGGGAGARCPYCRDDVAEDGEGCAACDACGTLHHTACLAEAGGCTLLGCAGADRRRARA